MRRRAFGLIVRLAAGIAIAALLVTAGAFSIAPGAKVDPRPEKWAQPVGSTAIRNWYKIDNGLYRSRQPDRKGFEAAKEMGIRTIVDLRSSHSDAKLVEGLGFNLVEIPMRAYAFSEDQVLRALRAIQAGPKPVLLHCQQGADRTGVVSAAYRVVIQDWTKDEAIAELKKGGYGFHWYYLNIPAFIRHMDVAQMRARLAEPIPPLRLSAAQPSFARWMAARLQ